MKNRNVGRQYFLSIFLILFAAVINYGIQLVLTPYVSETLGTEAYGFVSFANTFANYATVLTVAVNAVATRFISVEYHRGEKEKANAYYNTLFFADVIMTAGILIVSSVIVYKLDCFMKISESIRSDVKWLFLFAVLNTCIVSVGTVFNSATLIRNRLDIASMIKIVTYFSQAIILIVLFSQLAPHVYYVGISLMISSIVLVALNYAYGKMTIKELRIKRDLFHVQKLKDVFVTGIWYSFNSLGNMLNTGLDLWVSNLLISPLQMGELAIVKTVTTISSALCQLAAQPFQPILLKNYADRDEDKLIKNLKLAMKVNGCLSNILASFFIVFGACYFKLWVPSEDSYTLWAITIISMIGAIIEGMATPLFFVYVLSLKNKMPCIVTLISGTLNVVFMYVLISYMHMGLEVVVGTTAVLAWAVHFVFTPVYSAKCLNQKATVFYSTIIKNIFSAIVMVLLYCAIRRVFEPLSWISLVIIGAICGIIGGTVHYFIVFGKEEKNQLKELIFKKG